MTLGEIKLAALDLMLPNETGVTLSTLDTTTDETVKYYLDKMPPVINRCFADLERKKILETKEYKLTPQNAVYDEDGDIYRGDTPSMLFRFTEDFSAYDEVTLVFSQNGTEGITKDKDDMTFFGTEVEGKPVYCVQVTLTGTETSAFEEREPIEMQFTFVKDGKTMHSNIAVTSVNRILETDDD